MKGKEILRLVDSLHRDKDIEEEVLFQAIEKALQTAVKKHFGASREVSIEIDRDSGEMKAFAGDEPLEPEALGRIAAQSAKQIIIQKISEAESETIYREYTGKEGTLVTGSVQRMEGGTIIVNLGKAEAVMPRSEQIPTEHYQAGERVRAVIVDVRKTGQKVEIVLSRSHPDLIRRLFELEVPEVADAVVELRKIAREPGQRTKVAVISHDSRVDSIGACVGVRGTRIKSITDELNGEKIDIVPWNDAPEILMADTLRPAEILQITLEEGERTKRAIVTVPEDQLSLAIGRKGQNVRLAVKMTGWDIDIQPPEPPEEKPPAQEEPDEEAPPEKDDEESAPSDAQDEEVVEVPAEADLTDE